MHIFIIVKVQLSKLICSEPVGRCSVGATRAAGTPQQCHQLTKTTERFHVIFMWSFISKLQPSTTYG